MLRAVRRIATQRSASSLVLAEVNGAGELQASTLSAITAASELGGDVSVLVAAEDASAAASAIAGVSGVSAVLAASGAQYKGGVAESMTPLVINAQSQTGATHIIGPATAYGKNILPRVAAKLDVNQISDVTKIVNDSTFERPIYAGNAIATVESADAVKVTNLLYSCDPLYVPRFFRYVEPHLQRQKKADLHLQVRSTQPRPLLWRATSNKNSPNPTDQN